MRVLILTPYRNARFESCQATRVLLQALRERRVGYRLHRPWHARDDLETFDAVLTWSYGHPYERFYEEAVVFEAEATRRGLPVFAPARRSCWSRHSDDLHRWRLHGLGCPRYQRLHFGVDEITLPYPAILRRDLVHKGQNVRLVRDADEAREAWREGEALAEPHEHDPGDPRPFDMAIEFVDTVWPDGYYRKYRSYVVGDQVIACHLMHGETWLVNFVSLISTEATRAEHKRFMVGGEPRPGLMRRAAEAIDAEVVGIDYSVRPSGEVIFWEGNRRVNMAGDDGDENYRSVPPRRCDFAFGRAVVSMMLRDPRARARARRRLARRRRVGIPA